MPQLIPTVSIGVSRKEGTRSRTVFPKIGEMYEFTDDEVKEIEASNPKALRKPINENVQSATQPQPKAEPKAKAEVTSEEDEHDEPSARAARQATRKPQITGRRPTLPDEDDL